MIALRVRLLPAASAVILISASMAHAQTPVAHDADDTHVMRVAVATVGSIYGTVVDERGMPVEGAVVSALGGSTAFAVTDQAGQYRMHDLPAGPYVVRARREGFGGARSTLVNVRPAAKAPSSFTLRRVGPTDPPEVITAGVAGLEGLSTPRDESAVAWRLRRLTRSVLKDEGSSLVDLDKVDAEWFQPKPDGFFERAFDVSARLASNVFSAWPLTGQVNLLTATAYDDADDMVAFGPASGVAFFAVGAPVGDRGDWSAQASMNGGDVTSWTMAGDYASRAAARHQVSVGMTYSLQAYRGGNVAALQAVPDGHRKVASIRGLHEFPVSSRWRIGYGGRYEHYDYLGGYGLFSPSGRVTFQATPKTSLYAKASSQAVAPGAEEFVPPSNAHWVPPQRTFAPLTGGRFDTERVRHGEVGMGHRFGAATVTVAAFVQSVDDQLVTVFGAADPARLIAAGGHYGIASAGDASMLGWSASAERRFSAFAFGRVTYTTVSARWSPPSAADRRALANVAPEVLAPDTRIHDLSTTFDAEVPRTDTRFVLLYRLNSGFAESLAVPMGNGRFDVQLRQGLPFLDGAGDWEMLVGVRSLFRPSLEDRSLYDELLVVRAPKRVIGGLQVRF
jgi:TonB dependent receptor/Carboxypeptidase regulatory-like domain